MKKTALTIAVLAFAGLMGTQASAAPLGKAAGVTQGAAHADVIQVRDRNRNGIHDRRDRRNNNWRNDRRHYNDWRKDRRYYRYRNWNRYGYRPYNWRSRGCIAVGPFWFCR